MIFLASKVKQTLNIDEKLNMELINANREELLTMILAQNKEVSLGKRKEASMIMGLMAEEIVKDPSEQV